MNFIQRGGIAIPRQYENEMWYREIRADLLRRSQKYQTADYEILKFYIESQNLLTIPRFYPLQKFMKHEKFTFDDRRHEGKQIQIEHNIKPRNELQKRAMNYMLENDSGILELQPGTGKTVISISMIATRKRKTLILVHRDSLVEQWINRIEEFTNLDKSSVARLSSSTYEEDLTHPIIITTNQTMISILKRQRVEFLTAIHNAEIGIFIADEVHTTVGAPTFSECSIHLPCKVVFGLSATPYRWDGNGDIMEYHLGQIFAEEDDEGTLPAEVTVIGLDYEIDQPSRHGYLYWGGDFQRARYLNLTRKSENLLKTCERLITKLRKTDRHSVVMCERIKLIDELYNKLDDGDSSIFTAGHKLEVLKKRTTFTTPGKMRDGVDAPWKDSLLMTSPISNVAQVCGRVTRSKDGKQNPVVIDLVDISCKPIRNTIHTRLKYYEKKGWNVRFFIYSKIRGLQETIEEQFVDLLKEL